MKQGWLEDLSSYRKQYGDIFRLKFGPHHAVIISSAGRMKEVFVEKADYFSERPDYMLLVNKVVGRRGEWGVVGAVITRLRTPD